MSNVPIETSSPAHGLAPLPRYPGHPLFGNLHAFQRDRAGMQLTIARARPEAVHLRMGFLPATMVSSPRLAHEILQVKAASFAKAAGLTVFLRPVLGDGLLTVGAPRHAVQRKLLAPVFAHKRVASYADTMGERALRWASSLEDSATIDLAEETMRLTLEIVGKTLFDAEVAREASVVGEAVTTAMKTALAQISSLFPIPPAVPTPRNLAARRAVARLDAIVYELIRARRAEGRDHGDLLGMLLAARHEDGSPMTDTEVRDEAMTLFLAGHETTANALSWTFHLLTKNPEARARLEAEVDAVLGGGRPRAPSYADLERLPYTLAVVKEALRLYPPAYILARRSIEPVTIGEHRFGKHSLIFVNVLGIHRRPDVYADPEAFRPERFLGDAEKSLPRGAYIPFGAGPRVCIGNHFAMMEMQILLATIARHARFERASRREVEPEPLVTLRPKGGLPMRIARRPRT